MLGYYKEKAISIGNHLRLTRKNSPFQLILMVLITLRVHNFKCMPQISQFFFVVHVQVRNSTTAVQHIFNEPYKDVIRLS